MRVSIDANPACTTEVPRRGTWTVVHGADQEEAQT